MLVLQALIAASLAAATSAAPVACVTGATGFLGTELVAQLLEKGYDVRGTVRDPTNANARGARVRLASSILFRGRDVAASARRTRRRRERSTDAAPPRALDAISRWRARRRRGHKTDGRGAAAATIEPRSTRRRRLREVALGLDKLASLTLVQADLLGGADAFGPCVAGADVLFHTASPFKSSGITDPTAQLVAPAVQGTESAVAAALATVSVKKIVLTSSIAATMGSFADKAGGGCFDEDDWNGSSEAKIHDNGMDAYVCRAELFLSNPRPRRGYFSDESRWRRSCDISLMHRGDAAAASWIFL